MNKIAFIIVYYGQFNSYFPLWLKSCGYNADVSDFYIVTDIEYAGECPSNVKFIKMSWGDLVSRIQGLYDFKIGLKTPYGLCDYKCAYGEIFEDIISGYSHWAYGDNDLLWGKWLDFLPKDWHSYDKLGEFGHLTIVRNNKEMNRLYRYNDAYKFAFEDLRNTFFDENGFNRICEVTDKKCTSFKICDCNPRVRKITPITRFDDSESGLYCLSNGRLYHLINEDGKISGEEIMYIHFLKRPIRLTTQSESESYMIHDVVIEPYKGSGEDISDLIDRYSRHRFYAEYWKKYLSYRQIRNSIMARIKPLRPVIDKIESVITSKN